MKIKYVLSSIVFLSMFMMVVVDVWAQEPVVTPSPDRLEPTPLIWQQFPDFSSDRIVGGQPATVGEYPWQVALVDSSSYSPLSGQYCGGSLVDSEWVLTAAHCVVDMGLMNDPDNIDIVLGVNNLSDGPDSGVLGQRIAVDRVVPYSGYNENTSDADLALLHLETPASLVPTTVSTISLATTANNVFFAPGVTAIVTGWGATSESGSGSDALLEVDVPIVPNSVCNVSYEGDITGNMLCAGLVAGGKDSCYGYRQENRTDCCKSQGARGRGRYPLPYCQRI